MQLASTDRDVNGPVFVAYLLGLVVVLPLASVWALAEKSRWGTGVLVIAGLVLLGARGPAAAAVDRRRCLSTATPPRTRGPGR